VTSSTPGEDREEMTISLVNLTDDNVPTSQSRIEELRRGQIAQLAVLYDSGPVTICDSHTHQMPPDMLAKLLREK
jgi:hypothetical protein